MNPMQHVSRPKAMIANPAAVAQATPHAKYPRTAKGYWLHNAKTTSHARDAVTPCQYMTGTTKAFAKWATS